MGDDNTTIQKTFSKAKASTYPVGHRQLLAKQMCSPPPLWTVTIGNTIRVLAGANNPIGGTMHHLIHSVQASFISSTCVVDSLFNSRDVQHDMYPSLCHEIFYTKVIKYQIMAPSRTGPSINKGAEGEQVLRKYHIHHCYIVYRVKLCFII